MSDPTFTREYFLDEIRRLRDAFGTKQFWKDPDAAARATKALGYVYLRTPDALATDQIVFQATISELARREFHVLMMSPLATEERP